MCWFLVGYMNARKFELPSVLSVDVVDLRATADHSFGPAVESVADSVPPDPATASPPEKQCLESPPEGVSYSSVKVDKLAAAPALRVAATVVPMCAMYKQSE